MKKIVILTIALALAVGMPLLASEFTFGGDMDWGFGSDFDAGFANSVTATADIKATVDDFNAVSFSVKRAAGTALLEAANEVILEKAQLATNLGSALKLPVGVTFYAGYFNFGSEEYSSITGYDLGYVADFTGSRWQWGTAINLMDKVTLEAATSWDFVTADADYWLGAHGVFGPVSAEVWYADVGTARFGLDAQVALAIMEGSTLKIAGGYATNLDTDVADIGIAAKFNYNIFGLGLGLQGDDVEFARLVAVELSVAPAANFGVNVGALLDLPGTDVLNNIDASVYYKAGAATWTVGYLYTADVGAAATWNAVKSSATTGGLFIKSSIDY